MTDTINIPRSVIEDTIHALERYAVKRQDFERFESELAMLKAALAAPQLAPLAQPEPQPVKQTDDWEIRGKLTALKCWHRLTESEAEDLVSFFGAQPVKQAWQPIETAPKYKEVLVWRDDSGAFIAKLTTPDGVLSDDQLAEMDFPDDFEEWFSDAYGWQEKEQKPTHWMPLPPPPEAKP